MRLTKLVEGNRDPQAFLKAPERNKINNAMRKNPIFSGNTRVHEVADAISPLAEALRSVGFTLDMVTGDLLLGGKGTRHLTFRRTHPDSYEEFPVIENSRISLNWEELEPGRVEVIAYAS